MKKILFGAIALLLIASCGGKNESEKGKDRSNRTADSLAQEEAIRQAQEAAQAALEQERLDSIRQDSIRQEEKMRIDPMIFARDGYEKKLLKQYGFKVVYDRKFINYDIGDEGFEDYEIRYTRNFNGRKIVYDAWGTTCMGATLTFYDPIDKKNFIEDIKKAGYRKENSNCYIRENPWHQITINGKEVQVVDCG